MTGADLSFDPVAHRYSTPDGRVVPSVTQILRDTNVTTDFDAIRAMGGRRAEAIDLAAAIGTACHQDIHAFDDNDLDWRTVHPDVLPFVEAWAAFRETKKVTPLVRERMVLHEALGYCGTLDGIFQVEGLDQPVLIDVKTGAAKGAEYQTAGYLLAYQTEHPGAAAVARWCVQLTPERRVPYVITPFADWKDFDVWRAIVTTYWAGRRLAA